MAVGTGTAILGAAAIGALGSRGGGGSVQTQNSNAPWVNQQPYLQQGFNQAFGLLNRGGYNYAASPYTLQAQQMQANRALDPNSLTSQAQGTIGDTISGKYLNPSSNPFLGQYVNDALGQVGSKFAGMYGGAAGANTGNSGYQEGLARTLANTALPIYANAYQQERGNQMNATQMAPSLDYANIAQLGNVGAAQEGRAQAQFNSPWSNLQNYQSSINGNFGSQGTQQTPYFTNPMANAMGMGLGGLAMYRGLGGGQTQGAQGFQPFSGPSPYDNFGSYGWGQ